MNLAGGGVLAPPFLGLGSGLASPYGVGVGGVGLPAFGALTLTPASPALRALAAPPLPLATVLLVSNLNEEVRINQMLDTICSLFTMCMSKIVSRFPWFKENISWIF